MTDEQNKKTILERFAGRGVFPYQMAFTLLIPFRNLLLSPRVLIGRLELEAGQSVLEIGPGPGYFSVPVARALAGGMLYLYDIQQKMLDYAKKRLDRRGISNVRYCLADGGAFPFEEGQFDRIFLVTVLGEVADRDGYLREMRRVLKADGMVSVSETAGDPDKMSKEQLRDLFGRYGFEVCKEYGGRWNYTVNFRCLKARECREST